MTRLVALALLLTPSLSWACGGLFCNAANPVNQNAERILFAPDDGTMVMHVRITYQGPPTEFGWLLPVPATVEYGLSSEQLFTALDQQFGPQFILRREFGEGCDDLDFGVAESAPNAAGGPQEDSDGRGVEVLSREAVGPYDLALLQAENVEVLREWLNENEYQIPDNVDATLQPYIDMGAAFVALKLLPDADSGDVTPLRLSFPGDTPTIPIVPTSVAADPDMGIIVHVLGQTRAIPSNYRHVSINEAAIDWLGAGANYADVVSQAADEAGGQAFTTDFAGTHDERINLATIDDDFLDTLAIVRDFRTGWAALEALVNETRGDADITQILLSVIAIPEGSDIDPNFLVQCPRCVSNNEDLPDIGVDGEALVMKLTALNEVREELNALFGRLPYLTRLYGTMSPSEMTLDPTFSFNADLEVIDNIRRATMRIECGEDGFPGNTGEVITESGFMFRIDGGDNPNIIRRQNGETVRGMDVMGAAVVSQQMPAGQPEVVEDNREMMMDAQGTDGEVTDDTMMSGTPTTNPAVMTPDDSSDSDTSGNANDANDQSSSNDSNNGTTNTGADNSDSQGASPDDATGGADATEAAQSGGSNSGGCACDATSDQADLPIVVALLLPLAMMRRRRRSAI